MTQPITDDDFRAMHAQHLRDEASHIVRQTAALESIRTLLAVLVFLIVASVVIGAVVANAGA